MAPPPLHQPAAKDAPAPKPRTRKPHPLTPAPRTLKPRGIIVAGVDLAARHRADAQRLNEADAAAYEALRISVDARDAADRRADIQDRVEQLRTGFASSSADAHRRAAYVLGGITDETLSAVQRAWYEQVGSRLPTPQHLYTYLNNRMIEAPSDGLVEALGYLRHGFEGNDPMHKEFLAVFTAADTARTVARAVHDQFRLYYTETRRDRVVGLLRSQPRAMLPMVDKAFADQFGKTLVDWLIDEQWHDPPMIRAIALLRNGSDTGVHVRLAEILIPTLNRNKELPLAMLKAMPAVAERRRVAYAYHLTFNGVGRGRNRQASVTLFDHLDAIDRFWDHRFYMQATALLDHDLTLAEQLWVALAYYDTALDDSAIKLLKQCDTAEVPRAQLEADWDRYVRKRGFTSQSVQDHIAAVFRGKPIEARTHIPALLAALQTTEQAQDESPAAAAPNEKNAFVQALAEDGAIGRRENRHIRNAMAALHAVEGHFGKNSLFSNDTVIIDSLKTITAIYAGRVERLEKRLAGLGENVEVTTQQRVQLQTHYQAAIAAAQDQRSRVMQVLEDDLAGGSINMGADKRMLARLAVAGTLTTADEVYVAVTHNEWDAAEKLVTRAWAKRGIDKMIADGRQPGLDANKQVLRPSYELRDLTRDKIGKLPRERTVALVVDGQTDGERGARRLLFEMKQVTSDPDLAAVVGLLGSADLDAGLRAETLQAFLGHLVEDGSARASDNPATAFQFHVEDVLRHHYSATADNFVRLAGIVAPPGTQEEMVAHARELMAASHKGRLHFLVEGVADIADLALGDATKEARDQSQRVLEGLKDMTEAERAEQRQIYGVATDLELAKLQLEHFEELHDQRRTIEATCAALTSGAVEVLVEAGLAAVTGGAGFVAIMGSLAAGVAGMVASSAMLGPNYKLISMDNINSEIQSALMTGMVECNIRGKLGIWLKLEKLIRSQGPRALAQNVITGGFEALTMSGAEALTKFISSDQYPSNADIARAAEMTLGRLIAKVSSTPRTIKNNPQIVNALTHNAELMSNALRFKLAMKISETFAKETVSFLMNPAQDRSISDWFVQVLWKETRSWISTDLRTRATTMAAIRTYDKEKDMIREMWRRHPDMFRDTVTTSLREIYFDPVAGAALREKHDAMRKAGGHPASPAQFMLYMFYAEEEESVTVRGGLHKALRTASKIAAEKPSPVDKNPDPQEKPAGQDTQAPHAAQEPPAGQAPARPKPSAHFAGAPYLGGSMTRALTLSRRVAAQLTGLPPEVEADPTAPGHAAFETARGKLDEVLRRQALQHPAEFARRLGHLEDVLDPTNLVRLQLDAGNHQQLDMLLRGHGNWTGLIEVLEAVGDGPRAISVTLVQRRNQIAAALGLKTDPGATSKPGSDLDGAFIGVDPKTGLGPNQRMLAAEANMVRDWGPHWRTVLHMNFYTDAKNLSRYRDIMPSLSGFDRNAVLRKVTHSTEDACYAKMRQVTERPGNEALRGLVAQAAHGTSYDQRGAQKFLKSMRDRPVDKLAVALDSDLAAYETMEHMPVTPRAQEARAALAMRITRSQQEMNFLSHEAFLAPGASLSTLGGKDKIKVVGAEAYQAVLNHFTMYVEHRGTVDNERDYEPYKYMDRIIQVARMSGIDASALEAFADIANIASKSNRETMRKQGALPDSVAYVPRKDIAAMLKRFETALIPVMAQMRQVAYDDPDPS